MKRMLAWVTFLIMVSTPALMNSGNVPEARFRGGTHDGHSSWILLGAKLPMPGTLIIIR